MATIQCSLLQYLRQLCSQGQTQRPTPEGKIGAQKALVEEEEGSLNILDPAGARDILQIGQKYLIDYLPSGMFGAEHFPVGRAEKKSIYRLIQTFNKSVYCAL